MAQLAAAAAAATAHSALVVAEGPAASARAARPERLLLSLFAGFVPQHGVVSSRGAQQFDVLSRRQRAAAAAAAVQPQEAARPVRAARPQAAARPAGAAAVGAARPRSGPCRPSGRWRSSRASSWPSLACAASTTSSARRHCSLAASGGALMGTGQLRDAPGSPAKAHWAATMPRSLRATRVCSHSAACEALVSSTGFSVRVRYSQRRRAPGSLKGRLSSTTNVHHACWPNHAEESCCSAAAGERCAGARALPLVPISGEHWTPRRAHRASGCLLYLYRQWSSLISEPQSP